MKDDRLAAKCTDARFTNFARARMNEAMGDGFAFAYRYPGMHKVLQAAGRLIRSDTDRGVLLLLDDRYMQND